MSRAAGCPAGMMLAQLGLQLIRYLPLVLPLGLMLGLLLAVGRLYRDAEMPVLTSIGIGPRRHAAPVADAGAAGRGGHRAVLAVVRAVGQAHVARR